MADRVAHFEVHARDGKRLREVERLEDALAKARRLGGTTLMDPQQVPGGPRIASFADPEGNTIGLFGAGSL